MGVETRRRTQDGNRDRSGDGVNTGTGRGWRPVDEHRMRAGTGMRVEARRRSLDGNRDGGGDGDRARTGTGTGVETPRLTQYGNGDRSGDGTGTGMGKGCRDP